MSLNELQAAWWQLFSSGDANKKLTTSHALYDE
jgi:hypothetical protein